MIRAEAEPTGGGHPREVYVVLRVLPDRDSRVVRYGAVVALVFALAFFVVFLAAPESLGIGF